MINAISKVEFERNMFDLQLHGINPKDIASYRNTFESNLDEEKKKQVDMPSLTQLRSLGLSAGRPSKTRFKR